MKTVAIAAILAVASLSSSVDAIAFPFTSGNVLAPGGWTAGAESLSDRYPFPPKGMTWSGRESTYTAFVNGKQYNCTEARSAALHEKLGHERYKEVWGCGGIKIVVTSQGHSARMLEVDRCITSGYEITEDRYTLIDKAGSEFSLRTTGLKKCRHSPEILYRVGPGGNSYASVQTATASSDVVDLRFVSTTNWVLIEEKRPSL